jgi:hypothetical protein
VLHRRAHIALLLAVVLCSCTQTIESGEYGPFQIGESKRATLQKLLALDRTIVPLPHPDTYIESPCRNNLEQLSGRSGVLVWVEHEPLPLRIEFFDAVVTRTWPNFDPASYRGPNPEVNTLLASLQNSISPGTTEQVAFDAISTVGADHHISVGVFVVGYQPFYSGEKSDADAFEALLMANDSWRFEGLREELWLDHYYSQVTLVFAADTLSHIEHWRFLFEMP